MQQKDQLEVEKQKLMARIESERFAQLIQSLGSDTLKEMARAGPEMQVTLCRLHLPSVGGPKAHGDVCLGRPGLSRGEP